MTAHIYIYIYICCLLTRTIISICHIFNYRAGSRDIFSLRYLKSTKSENYFLKKKRKKATTTTTTTDTHLAGPERTDKFAETFANSNYANNPLSRRSYEIFSASLPHYLTQIHLLTWTMRISRTGKKILFNCWHPLPRNKRKYSKIMSKLVGHNL